MANTIITPSYGPDNLKYRIPDNDTSPAISQKDYFYSANGKYFLYKQLGSTLTNVRLDFYNLDCAYFINNNFTTP
jgi:hypothetical protein